MEGVKNGMCYSLTEIAQPTMADPTVFIRGITGFSLLSGMMYIVEHLRAN